MIEIVSRASFRKHFSYKSITTAGGSDAVLYCYLRPPGGNDAVLYCFFSSLSVFTNTAVNICISSSRAPQNLPITCCMTILTGESSGGPPPGPPGASGPPCCDMPPRERPSRRAAARELAPPLEDKEGGRGD